MGSWHLREGWRSHYPSRQAGKRVVASNPLCDAGGDQNGRRGEERLVPLSEDEERILSEIEERLSETDPDLVREVSETTVFTQPLRSMKWAVVGFAGGVLVMVVTLSTSFLLAFVGFLVMLGASLALERNARQVGRTGLRVVAGSGRTAGIREAVGGTGARVRERMRDRFRRGDHGQA